MGLINEICHDWAVQRPDIDCPGKAVVCSLLSVHSAYLKALEMALKPLKMQPNAFSALVTIRRKGISAEVSVSKIRAEVLVSSGGITNLLNRLVKDNLISKRVSESDARSMLVSLTPKGLELINKAMEIQAKVESEFTKKLVKKEYQALEKLLSKLLPQETLSC